MWLVRNLTWCCTPSRTSRTGRRRSSWSCRASCARASSWWLWAVCVAGEFHARRSEADHRNQPDNTQGSNQNCFRWTLLQSTYDASHEAEVARHHVLEVVGDEDASHVQLDLVHLLAVAGEGVARRLFGNEEDRLERNFALRSEVRVRHRVGWIFAKAAVEVVVLAVVDLRGSTKSTHGYFCLWTPSMWRDGCILSSPDWFVVVDQCPVPHSLVDLLRLGLVFFVLFLLNRLVFILVRNVLGLLFCLVFIQWHLLLHSLK